MAMGIPIITNAGIGDSDSIISDSNAGIMIQNFSEEEYNRIIQQIDVILSINKTKIIETSRKYFSLESGTEVCLRRSPPRRPKSPRPRHRWTAREEDPRPPEFLESACRPRAT